MSDQIINTIYFSINIPTHNINVLNQVLRTVLRIIYNY